MSKHKVFGILLFAISNSYLAACWQSWSVTVAGLYTCLSVLEYFVLRSAVVRADDSPAVRQISKLLSAKLHRYHNKGLTVLKSQDD